MRRQRHNTPQFRCAGLALTSWVCFDVLGLFRFHASRCQTSAQLTSSPAWACSRKQSSTKKHRPCFCRLPLHRHGALTFALFWELMRVEAYWVRKRPRFLVFPGPVRAILAHSPQGSPHSIKRTPRTHRTPPDALMCHNGPKTRLALHPRPENKASNPPQARNHSIPSHSGVRSQPEPRQSTPPLGVST
jgi:hypothetical protein